MSATFTKVTLEERVRRYLAAMDPAIAGQQGHTALFNAVRALIHGFGFTPGEALPFLQEYNLRCQPPWSEGELAHKLRSVDGLASKWPRGYLRNDDANWKPSQAQRRDLGIPTEAEVRKKVEYEEDKLKRIAAPWRDKVDLLWLANRSTMDPAEVTADKFLRALYGPAEKVLCFINEFSQGDALWPVEAPPTEGKMGVWYLPQPVTGEYVPNPDGKQGPNGEPPAPSRRIGRCVTAFRYLILESDEAPMRDWLGFIVQAPLRIEALYTSGSRSIHALVRINARTYEEWHAKKRELLPFLAATWMCGADPNTSATAVRLSRLPGCLRLGKMKQEVIAGVAMRRYVKFQPPGEQKLLYFRPGAEARPICDLPIERNVEATWLERARAAVDGHESDAAELRRGLKYYVNVSAGCRAALADMEAGS